MEVSEEASQVEIKSAYFTLAHQCHPDKVPCHLTKLRQDAEEKVKQIDDAYQCLSDENKRNQYDAKLEQLRAKVDPPHRNNTSSTLSSSTSKPQSVTGSGTGHVAKAHRMLNPTIIFPVWLLVSLVLAFCYWAFLLIGNRLDSNVKGTQDTKSMKETVKRGEALIRQVETDMNPVPSRPPWTDPRASTGLIAFVARSGSRREIFTMRPDGSCQRNLSSQLQDAFAPVWSPDGTQVLFRGGGAGDFYITSSDGSNTRKVLDLAQVAPDFPGVEPVRINTDGQWLQDGKTIAICAGIWPEACHIYLVELPSLKRSIMPLTRPAWQPAWSPDGTKMAFITFNQANKGDKPFQIWFLDLKTSKQTAVSRKCDIQAGPLWLPDGKRIIFIEHGPWSNGRQNNKLCMKNIENGEYIETDFSWDVAQIVVSPDGQNIAFSEHSSPVYVFQLIGNAWQQRARIDKAAYPTWSPDGTSLGFVSSEDHQIWLAHADGTGQVRIRPTSDHAPADGTQNVSQSESSDSDKERPEWSPNGRPYATSHARTNGAVMTSSLSKAAEPLTFCPRVQAPRPKHTQTPREPNSVVQSAKERQPNREAKTPAPIEPEDSLPYEPAKLRISDEGASGWLLTDGTSRMMILDNEADARDALALAKRHTARCFIGRSNTRSNRRDYITEYWKGNSGLETSIVQQDCIAYDPANLRIVDEGANGWLLTDGTSQMLVLNNHQDAQNALILAKRYTKQCFIGRNNTRSNRKNYIVQYWE